MTFLKIRILPKNILTRIVKRRIKKRSTRTRILMNRFPIPTIVAQVGVAKILHMTAALWMSPALAREEHIGRRSQP